MLVAFISLYNYETPKQLFNSLDPCLDLAAKHVTWLQEILSVVNNRNIQLKRKRSHLILPCGDTGCEAAGLHSCGKTPRFQMSIHPFLLHSTVVGCISLMAPMRSFCGLGCLCQGCINLPATHDSDKLDDDSTSS